MHIQYAFDPIPACYCDSQVQVGENYFANLNIHFKHLFHFQ